MLDTRLKEATIKYFRSVEEATLLFAPEVTLLVGPNASGKSNLLTALAWSRGLYVISNADSAPRFPSQWQIVLKGADGSPHALSSVSIQDMNTIAHSFWMWPLRSYDQRSAVLTSGARLASDGRNLGGAVSWFRGIFPNEVLQSFLEKCKRIVPEIRQIGSLPLENGYAELALEVSGKDGDLRVSAATASTGTLDVIFLVLVLHQLPPGSVLLLDSPDSHLHQGAQVELMKLFREIAKAEHKQFVIATHSPTLVSSCTPEEVFLVTREALKTKVSRISDLKPVLQVLDNTDATLSDFVGAQKPS